MNKSIVEGIMLMIGHHKVGKNKNRSILYYLDDVKETEELQNTQIVGIVVPFLYMHTLEKTNQLVEKLLEVQPKLIIFVVSIFADISSVINLSRWKKQIYLANVMLIVSMESLVESLKVNCTQKDFDFFADENFVKLVKGKSREMLEDN